MDAVASVPILVALVYGTVATYLLAFRPLRRTPALLAAALAANAFMYLILDGDPFLRVLEWIAALVTIVAFAAFFAIYPRPLRWRSASGAALLACIAWALGSFGMLVSGEVARAGPPSDTERIFGSSLGGNLVLVALMLARLTELRASRDRAESAARWLYLAPLGLVFMAGGIHAARTGAALAGLDSYPAHLYTTTSPVVASAFVLMHWVVPLGVVVVGLARWRWLAPPAIALAGAASYALLLLAQRVEPVTILTLIWSGELFTPAFVLYAQARWSPFEGEPASLRSGLAVTAVSALLAYLSVFALVLILAPDSTLASVVGPILGFVGAAGIAALVLPRARRLALLRLFPTAPGSGADALPAGRSILGRYHIVRLLAEGGQGRVYEATDARGGGSGRVVLKAVTSDHAAREARILRELHHPNVVRFVDVVEVTGLTLLVLEYAEGGDVRGLMTRRGGRLPAAEAEAIALGVMQGLAAAHARGVAHRDVKPENVLLDASGTPKLTDFGAARQAGPEATIRVGGLGTLAYLAPEQFRGEPGDARTDVYAAAILIHELMTGVRLFQTGADDHLARLSILQGAPRLALPEAAARFEPVLARALAKEPAERYQDAREMLAAWEGAVVMPSA